MLPADNHVHSEFSWDTGVNASMEDMAHGLIDYWIWPIKQITRKHPWLNDLPMAKRRDVLCELNVVEQAFNLAECKVLKRAWGEGHEVDIHGWIYDVKDGKVRDPVVCMDRAGDAREQAAAAEAAIRARSAS